MICYKVDIMEELKRAGYPSGRIQKEKLIPGQTLQNIKDKKMINLTTLNKVCAMTRKQPGELIEFIPTDEEKIKYY